MSEKRHVTLAREAVRYFLQWSPSLRMTSSHDALVQFAAGYWCLACQSEPDLEPFQGDYFFQVGVGLAAIDLERMKATS